MSFSWSFSFSLTNLYKWDWIEYIWANQKFSLSWFGVECLLYNRRLKKYPNKWVIMVPSPCSAGKGNILPPTATRTTEKFLRSEVDYKWYIWDPHYLRKNIHPQVQVWLKGFRNPRLSHPLRHIYFPKICDLYITSWWLCTGVIMQWWRMEDSCTVKRSNRAIDSVLDMHPRVDHCY